MRIPCLEEQENGKIAELCPLLHGQVGEMGGSHLVVLEQSFQGISCMQKFKSTQGAADPEINGGKGIRDT